MPRQTEIALQTHYVDATQPALRHTCRKCLTLLPITLRICYFENESELKLAGVPTSIIQICPSCHVHLEEWIRPFCQSVVVVYSSTIYVLVSNACCPILAPLQLILCNRSPSQVMSSKRTGPGAILVTDYGTL